MEVAKVAKVAKVVGSVSKTDITCSQSFHGYPSSPCCFFEAWLIFYDFFKVRNVDVTANYRRRSQTDYVYQFLVWMVGLH